MKRKYNWPNHILNFLAVILGVYLAFYVNERAKTNSERKESMALMSSLINDLSADIKTYENYQIPVNTQHQKNVDSLLELLKNRDLEAISGQLPTLFQLENYAPTSSTYSSMKASGKIRLLEDLALQKRLNDFYEGLVLESTKKGEYQAEYFTDELMSWLTENADFMTMEIRNNEDLITLRNKLMIYESLIDQKVSNYKMIVEESRQLSKLLDSLLVAK